MNILFKIAILSFIYILIAILLRNYRPEYVFLLRIFAVITIIYLAIDFIESFVDSFSVIFNTFNIESSHISLMIKIIGIAVVTDFISDILIDNGETAMANIVTIFSKFLVLYLTFPILNGIIVFCLKFLE